MLLLLCCSNILLLVLLLLLLLLSCFCLWGVWPVGATWPGVRCLVSADDDDVI